jgi:hypothetical protein
MFSLILSRFYIDMKGKIAYYGFSKKNHWNQVFLEVNSRALAITKDSLESPPRRMTA